MPDYAGVTTTDFGDLLVIDLIVVTLRFCLRYVTHGPALYAIYHHTFVARLRCHDIYHYVDWRCGGLRLVVTVAVWTLGYVYHSLHLRYRLWV